MSKKSKDRLAFNFLKSYYEVFKKLTDDKSKAEFVQAICERQFNGIETDLEGMADFAYVSQKHSIDASREGWENLQKRTKVVTPSTPPSITPSTQEKEEVKEKVKDKKEVLKSSFLETLNILTKKKYRAVEVDKLILRLKVYSKPDIANAIKNATKDQWNIDNGFKYLTPDYWVRNDKQIDKWLNTNPDTSSGVVLGLDVLGSAMGKQDYNQKIMKSLCDKYGYSIEEIGEMHKEALRKKGHTEEGIKELYKMYNY